MPVALEGSVNRWVGTVNAKPGGVRFRDAEDRHRPEPKEHSRLLMVGDYLFDSTINGVVDSAEIATDLLAKALIKLQAKAVVMLQKTNGIGTDRATVKDNYFKHSDGSREYGESFKDYFD